MKNLFRASGFSVSVLAASLAVLGACTSDDGSSGAQAEKPAQRLKVATTTSLYDTGLWNLLEDRFERRHNLRLDILYAGTGIAMEYGRRGDVDVLVVHDRAREEQFIADGYGLERVPFACNFFVIAGPADDPAGIGNLGPAAALKKLYQEREWAFISRGDESGTHAREKAVWKAAGLDYETVRTSGAWYVEAGRGMGPTMLMAGEMRGYTLADVGTFLAFRGTTGLAPIVDRSDLLLNVYSIIAINPDRVETARFEEVRTLIDFLVSDEIQELIGAYGIEEYGAPLFIPCAGREPTD